jgi:hypothetical protein
MTPAALTVLRAQREVIAALNELMAGRMLGVIPFMTMPCEEQDIPTVLRTLHRHDATHAYETARDHLFHAIGLTAASDRSIALSTSKGVFSHSYIGKNHAVLGRWPCDVWLPKGPKSVLAKGFLELERRTVLRHSR